MRAPINKKLNSWKMTLIIHLSPSFNLYKKMSTCTMLLCLIMYIFGERNRLIKRKIHKCKWTESPASHVNFIIRDTMINYFYYIAAFCVSYYFVNFGTDSSDNWRIFTMIEHAFYDFALYFNNDPFFLIIIIFFYNSEISTYENTIRIIPIY